MSGLDPSLTSERFTGGHRALKVVQSLHTSATNPQTLNGAFRDERRIFGDDVMAMAPPDQPFHHAIGIRFARSPTPSRNG